MPKMSISGQIVSDIVAQLYLENSIQTLLIFFGVDPSHHFSTLLLRHLQDYCDLHAGRMLKLKHYLWIKKLGLSRFLIKAFFWFWK